ncbi:MAG: TRAP transporter large permease [Chloroflexota bacterium]|nr:TRAP transporter large permease [Chloroflexota bacterium]
MNLELASIVLLGSLLLLLALGVEIAVSMGIVATIGLVFFVHKSIGEFAYAAWGYMNSFTLTAVPLFVFMGAVFSNTGTITALFRGAERLIGFLPGGIASSVLGANAIFGAICGSSVAAAATFGKIAYPEMERLGYDPRLSLGSIAVGGTLSVLIPPSVIMIFYGSWEQVSVARLFAAGLIPGVLLAMLLIATVVIMVMLNRSLAPRSMKYTWKDRLIALKEIGPFAVVIVLILGVIFGGIMTPTEGASMGAAISIIFAAAYRKMTFQALKASMWSAMKITAMIAYVAFTASVLGMVFQYLGLTDAFSAFMTALPLGKYGIFAIICVMYLILGCFFDSFSMLVLTLPFISPIIRSLGFDAVWFGIVYVVLAEIGLVTPPFGLNLFVLNSVVPQHGVMTIARGALPFLLPLGVLIVLLTIYPQIALWLPGVLY